MKNTVQDEISELVNKLDILSNASKFLLSDKNEISAKEKIGIKELLETILLVVDLEELQAASLRLSRVGPGYVVLPKSMRMEIAERETMSPAL